MEINRKHGTTENHTRRMRGQRVDDSSEGNGGYHLVDRGYDVLLEMRLLLQDAVSKPLHMFASRGRR